MKSIKVFLGLNITLLIIIVVRLGIIAAMDWIPAFYDDYSYSNSFTDDYFTYSNNNSSSDDYDDSSVEVAPIPTQPNDADFYTVREKDEWDMNWEAQRYEEFKSEAVIVTAENWQSVKDGDKIGVELTVEDFVFEREYRDDDGRLFCLTYSIIATDADGDYWRVEYDRWAGDPEPEFNSGDRLLVWGWFWGDRYVEDYEIRMLQISGEFVIKG